MEDSGFDSDQRSIQNGIDIVNKQTNTTDTVSPKTKPMNVNEVKIELENHHGPGSELHRKLERQRDAARRGYNEKTKSGLLARSRLRVPGTSKDYSSTVQAADQQPLVTLLDTDESEDEFLVPRLSAQAQREITQQLIKDGYNLDLEPDDEDLDLIPPRPVSERCMCCHTQLNCCVM